jgi:catabolite regulation protein CreA
VQSFSHVAVVPGSGTETRNHFLSFVHRSAQSSDEEVYKGAGDNDMMSSSQPSRRHLKSLFSVFATASVLASSYLAPLPAMAAESQVIGQIQGSGLFFKDTLEVERFEDPKIKGITLYITNFQRPITERLTTNFLQDPSYASVACAKTSPTVAIADNINTSPQGEEVFEESKSILFKTLRGKY